ncbi:MAG: bifunctional diaminohydroxyphosphoribosylaminopyrimidine deaminase/5-amino-6-(5-phosphoribosylamino)uracil reductase RibD [bacterium]
MKNNDNDDVAWMKRALWLARKGEGETCQHPMVGAVIVKHGHKVSEGWFRRPGEPHAEVHALREGGANVRGSTIYLNLEPCSHYGQTPPCADALVRAGIKRVVAGMMDPNPLVSGRGFAMLRDGGVKVDTGVLEKECQDLNRVFTKYITTKRPYVILKAAATLDGNIATKTGNSLYITGEEARKEVHRLRDIYQAVMVGAGTVKADNPQLTVRRQGGKNRHPRPVVLSSKLDFPLKSNFMSAGGEDGPLIFTSKVAGVKKIKSFRQAGAEVEIIKKDRSGGLDLKEIMKQLGERQIASVLLEGGGGLFSSFLRANMADEVVMFFAPRMLAGDGIPLTRGTGPRKMEDALLLDDLSSRRLGEDIMITGRVINGRH